MKALMADIGGMPHSQQLHDCQGASLRLDSLIAAISQLRMQEVKLTAQQASLVPPLVRLLQQPTRDVLDESDELLKHTKQLVYAWGSISHLPDLWVRWDMTVAALEALAVFQDAIEMLQDPALANVDWRRDKLGAAPLILLAEGAAHLAIWHGCCALPSIK
jgi:Protein of unknown function (DUF3638)